MLDIHQYADLLPMMQEDEYQALKEDIRKNGLREPIKLYMGKIIDGRNRYRAMVELGLPPMAIDVTVAVEDPMQYVISHNLHRRHLSKSQIACIAVDAMIERGEGDYTLASIVFGVSDRYIQRAKAIKDGSLYWFNKVKTGQLTIPKAEENLSKQTRKTNDERKADIEAVLEDAIDDGYMTLLFDYAIRQPIKDLAEDSSDDGTKEWLLSDDVKYYCGVLGVPHSYITNWVKSGCQTTRIHDKLIELLEEAKNG